MCFVPVRRHAGTVSKASSAPTEPPTESGSGALSGPGADPVRRECAGPNADEVRRPRPPLWIGRAAHTNSNHDSNANPPTHRSRERNASRSIHCGARKPSAPLPP